MKTINTPWGAIIPSVYVFPVQYLFILYGVIHFLPFGIYNYLFTGEDSLIEWLQFFGYFCSFLFCVLIIFSKKRDRSLKQTISWILLTLFCFYVAGEEISWAERLTSIGSDSIREINLQGETNIHNLKGLNNYLHFSFISTGILLGWIGWKFWPNIEALPSKKFSLFFLIVAAFYFYFDLSWITLGERIRNDQEAIEFLMSSGIFLHCYCFIKEKIIR